jgi:hypothetical protein
MSVTCTHCSRLNPRDAVFCYHDGRPLAGSAVVRAVPGVQGFPVPLVFPSGRECRTFDQLALACQEDWSGAAAMLQQGFLEQFLGGIGRADLAMAARAAAAYPDRDRGLDQLLARLPSTALHAPRLDVAQSEIDLGPVKADGDRRIELRLANAGMRLLYGAVSSDSAWLVLGEAPGAAQKLFQCCTATTVAVRVLGKRLRAGNQGMTGRLVIDSNGGTQTVLVRVEVPATPFPAGVLAGATTPRQLAEKARAVPRDAAIHFEDGSVARWYEANGWTYPVQGPPAAGLGAVQQFFEALGLAKPPRVEVGEPVVSLRGQPGESLVHPLTVRTPDKRPVFAHGQSDQPWLAVGKARLNGPAATLPLEVTRVPARSGDVLQARVTVTANGGQRFVVLVSLAVGDALPLAAAITTLPPDTIETAPVLAGPLPVAQMANAAPLQARLAEPPRREERASLAWLHVLPLLPLFFVMALVLARDVIFGPAVEAPTVLVQVQHDNQDGPTGGKGGGKTKNGNGQGGQPTFKVLVRDEEPEFGEAVTTPLPVKVDIIDEKEEQPPPAKAMPVKVEIKDDGGIDVVPGKPGKALEVDPRPRVAWQYGPNQKFGITAVETRKRLTYSADGSTNQTKVRGNGAEADFGDTNAKVGQFTERDVKVAADPNRKTYGGSKSTWVSGKFVCTQILELVPSKQPVMVNGQPKLVLDTVLVRYIIENRDTKNMKVALRTQIDTLIGNNDGVPFTVPGLRGLVTNFADFPTHGPIPDFIQALENPDLQNPGTVAHFSFKLGDKIEPPDRISLTHWPGGNYPKWDVELVPLGGDSAVVLYWNDKVLKPGEKRVVGYAYGLGSVSSTEPGSKLGITLGGNFDPGEVFSVTAYVQNPANGQTVKLELPRGLERSEGDEMQTVPPPGAGSNNTSIVTWKVKVLQTGTFPLKVVSSNGASQSKTISIARQEGEGETRLQTELAGSFEPGQEFTVIAKLTGSGTGTPALTVPNGLTVTAGPTVKGAAPMTEATWRVKVEQPGVYPVKVAWAGAAVTKTVSIVRPASPRGGYVTLALAPPFAPGQAFTVSATVTEPLPDQTLKLELPPGLRLSDGKEVSPVPLAKDGPAVVTWKVLVERAGTFPLRVQSSSGLVLKKTIKIEQRDEGGGTFVLKQSGEIAPDKEFTIRAEVSNPVPGQKLTMTLPKGLVLADGAAVQTVPEAKAGNVSVVSWKVRVTGTGVLPVRVASTTGMARTMTITLNVQQPDGPEQQIFGGKR